MARLIVEGFDGLRALAGTTIPPTEWLAVDQDRVDAFAACTGDAQWIHLDVDRARASQFGGTIVHGYLTLALIPFLWHQNVDVRGIGMAINLGLDRVRFPAPLHVGKRIRAHFVILQASEKQRGLRVVSHATIEAEGGNTPVCVADLITFYRAMTS
jgi:acyl dehydratase